MSYLWATVFGVLTALMAVLTAVDYFGFFAVSTFVSFFTLAALEGLTVAFGVATVIAIVVESSN